MEYILKSTLISSSIYLFYKLFLTKETFFQSIRWYFLLGIAISLLLPLLIIPIYIEVAPIVQPEISTMPELLNSIEFQPELSQVPIEKPFNWIGFLSIIYVIGIVFLGLKFLFELFSLFRLIKMSTKKKMQNHYFVETGDNISPFSFFNYVVYNKKQFSKDELNDIISHEKVHVNQKHSIDNILIQLFVVFQWFNPFVWMYKKDLQQNLEYIADKTAQEQSINNKEYQYLLLKTSIKNNSFALSNNFFNSHLKKRIMMLQKSQTKKLNQLKYVLLLPLIALFLYSFNTKEVFIVKGEKQKTKTIVIDISHGGKDSGVVVDNIKEKEIVLQIANKIEELYNGNAKLIFTRDKDNFVSINDRIKTINRIKPDFVISLHVNSSININDNGVSAYISNDNSDLLNSKEIAGKLLNNLSSTKFNIKGLYEGNIKIISNVKTSAIDLEIGYLSNKNDREYLKSIKGQNEIAKAIIDFIDGKRKDNVKTKTIKKSSLKENIQPKFIVPIHKYNIKSVSGYGMRVNPITKKKILHKAIDYSAYINMDVYAAADGEVVKTGFDNEKGNFIEIKHNNGFQTNYHHLGNIQVAKYEKVKSGEIIGVVGSTGKSVAPYLHFEILKNGRNVNPINYLPMFKQQKMSDIMANNVKIKTNFRLNKDNTIIITNTTTKEKIRQFNNKFKDSKSKIRLSKVTRNRDNKITSFSILTKFNNQKKFYTNMRIKPNDNGLIKKYIIKKLNNKEAFKIVTDEKRKHYSIINKDGVKLFFDEGIKIKDTSSENNISSNTNIKLTKGIEISTKGKAGNIFYIGKTYFFLLEDGKLKFMNRYGKQVSNELANKLLLFYNKKYNTNYKLLN